MTSRLVNRVNSNFIYVIISRKKIKHFESFGNVPETELVGFSGLLMATLIKNRSKAGLIIARLSEIGLRSTLFTRVPEAGPTSQHQKTPESLNCTGSYHIMNETKLRLVKPPANMLEQATETTATRRTTCRTKQGN